MQTVRANARAGPAQTRRRRGSTFAAKRSSPSQASAGGSPPMSGWRSTCPVSRPSTTHSAGVTHAVDAASPELVGALRLHVHRRALAGRLPRRVGLRVVERVRRDAPPVALGVVAHVAEARPAREVDEAAVEAEAPALRLVDLGQVRVADRGEEAATETRRAPRRLLRRAADQDQ